MTGEWDRPNRVPWPPILFGAAAVVALVLDYLAPLGAWPQSVALRGVGAALMAAGIGLDGAAMLTMHRRKANILPHRAATALVTTGPFALSRNPIYLGNTLLLIGIGLAFRAPWFLPAALTAALAVSALAIRREEAHLAARFGQDWAAYAHRTPRWLTLWPKAAPQQSSKGDAS